MRRWIFHPWLTVRVQIALGVLFVAAALPKIVDPPAFAHMIYNYKLVPGSLLNLMALFMPWLELLCGLALILGIWRRTAAVIVGALLLVFIVAIGINLVRDNAVNCGCFEVGSANKTHDQLIDEMRWVVIRDILMLLMVAQIMIATRTPPAVLSREPS
jgi:putative oxidoreductase